MPHCVMRRPQAGAELGLEDPGELMPRSVESNLRGGRGETNKQPDKQTNKQHRYEKGFCEGGIKAPAQCPA